MFIYIYIYSYIKHFFPGDSEKLYVKNSKKNFRERIADVSAKFIRMNATACRPF